jgi:hypothetical protein
MASIHLQDPVSRYIAKLRLEATDRQWSAIEPHLTRFEGPGGLTLFEWEDVLVVVRRLSQAYKPPIAAGWSRRRASERVAS